MSFKSFQRRLGEARPCRGNCTHVKTRGWERRFSNKVETLVSALQWRLISQCASIFWICKGLQLLTLMQTYMRRCNCVLAHANSEHRGRQRLSHVRCENIEALAMCFRVVTSTYTPDCQVRTVTCPRSSLFKTDSSDPEYAIRCRLSRQLLHYCPA